MAKSGSSLFSTVGVFIALAVSGVYAIQNRDFLADAYSTGAGAIQKAANKLPDTPNAAAAENTNPSRTYGDFELKANDNGHFETPVEINGAEVDVMVDTGATLVAMTYEDAERAGISLSEEDFSQGVNTANGVAKVAIITLDRVSIGDITVRNVKGAVTERGRLHKTLLGMSFLGRLSRVEMQPDKLILHE